MQNSNENRKNKILLVEDNEISREVGILLLEKKGYIITAAENGETALALLESSKYDLIMMDLQMPVMDGYTATKKIREKEKFNGGHVIIIALTAYAMKEDVEKCLALGMDDYLSKPINAEEMYKKLEKWL
ncbi:MAG: response regulator [Bacillota bacterium]